jgi:hypothetical protein
MLVAWTVRFLICGSGGSGTLESQYADRAKDISAGTIKTASALWKAVEAVIPSDVEFKEAFGAAAVSKQYLARYYLRVLEAKARNPAGTELIVNPSEEKVTLEHIMPQARAPHWTYVPADAHAGSVKRIGNLTLLDKGLNESAGNVAFADKVAAFAKSEITITKELAGLTHWDVDAIDARQKQLADLAVNAWPAKPS